METPRISLVVPTQRRPEGLARAVRSLCRQGGVVAADLELVIVDNDATPSVMALAGELAREAPFAVRYVHEPEPGVANARNVGVARSRGDLIAFLDDDETATPGWLAALLDVQRRFDADAVFGPIAARLGERDSAHRAYLEGFFSRLGPAEAGLLDHAYGCGNSLVRRAALPSPDRPFRALRNFIGGEDDLLFGEMQARGARFAWAPAALVHEHPARERLALAYTLRRAFAYGQGPTSACAIRRPPDRLGVARWMAIGLFQALLFAPWAAVKWLARAPDRAFALDRLARALGKTLWWSPFKIRFYGRAG